MSKVILSKRMILLLVIALALPVLMLTVVQASKPNQAAVSIQNPEPLAESILIQHALEGAVVNGLKSGSGDAARDTELVDFTTYATLDTWNQTIGVSLLPEAAQFGLTSDMQVLVVVIRGEVHADSAFGLPQRGQVRGTIFDNIYVVVDVYTGDVISTSSYHPGKRLPLYTSEEYAGGSPAIVASQPPPESTAEVIPLPGGN